MLLRDGVVVLRVTIVCTLVRVSPHWPPPLPLRCETQPGRYAFKYTGTRPRTPRVSSGKL